MRVAWENLRQTLHDEQKRLCVSGARHGTINHVVASFTTGVHALLENPVVKTIKSDTYGTYWMECVGIVDYLKMVRTFDLDTSCDWLSKFHPVRYYKSFIFQTLHVHLDVDGNSLKANRIAVFVPTPRVNAQWDMKDTEYGKRVSGRKRPMPLASINTEKRILTWQQSLPNHFLVPAWLQQCRTEQDLISTDREHSADPCEYCG